MRLVGISNSCIHAPNDIVLMDGSSKIISSTPRCVLTQEMSIVGKPLGDGNYPSYRSRIGGALVVGPTKTRNRRTVTLPGFLADMIGEHVGRYPSRDGYVFTAPEGGAVRHHNFKARHFYPRYAWLGCWTDCASTICAIPAPRSSSARDGTPSRYRTGSAMPPSARRLIATGISSRATTPSCSSASTRA
jgi:hypothetical protein